MISQPAAQHALEKLQAGVSTDTFERIDESDDFRVAEVDAAVEEEAEEGVELIELEEGLEDDGIAGIAPEGFPTNSTFSFFTEETPSEATLGGDAKLRRDTTDRDSTLVTRRGTACWTLLSMLIQHNKRRPNSL